MVAILRGNLLQSTMALFFMLSTIYALVYLYQMGSDEQMQISGLTDPDTSSPPRPGTSWWSGILSIGFDDVFEIFSDLNPFILVKATLYTILPDMIYTMVNLFILRPVGWTVTLMEVDYVLNMIRGKTE